MKPLADRVRPKELSEVLGHEALTKPGGILDRSSQSKPLPSLIFWGPPGCGKTTLARIFAVASKARFIQLSAVLSGVADLRKAVSSVEDTPLDPRPAVIFVDEIHRWNKAQQDALLPHVEAGVVSLLGATTENPGFYIIPALRSRCRLIHLEPLDTNLIEKLILRTIKLESIDLQLTDKAVSTLAQLADGDARRALVLLEELSRQKTGTVDVENLALILGDQALRHDRTGDDHYDVLSAFIKSIRGSDPDAAVYWLARLLEAGEPPESIARRVIISASEDVGNADPRALSIAVDAANGVRMVGMPESRIILAQAVTYIASAPKSNAAYKAINEAIECVKQTGSLKVPNHLKNATTQVAKELNYGVEYKYPHDFPGSYVKQAYLPEKLLNKQFYKPLMQGGEKIIAERLLWWRSKN